MQAHSLYISSLETFAADSHLRLVEVDNDFQVGWPVIGAINDGSIWHWLQMWGEAGFQPLRARHHVDLLHPFFTETKHLTSEFLHLLVIYCFEFMQS